MTDFPGFHYKRFPKLSAYIDRIEAEQLNFRRFMIKQYSGSHYYLEKVLIKITNDHDIECKNPEYAPTEDEAKAIKEELSAVEFPKSVHASPAKRDELLASGQVTGNLYTFYDNARNEIVMCQERRETPDGKAYIPWTLFFSGGHDKWLQMEPDGALPFWKPEKRRLKGSIMVHEGAKSAAFVDDLINSRDPEWSDLRKSHPWLDELSDYEHWGAIGGALAPHRCDYGELHREKIVGRVVYVCDHDRDGEEAVKTFSRMYGGEMLAIMFNNLFPSGWDLADKVPETLFNTFKCDNGIEHRIVKQSLMSLARPATWVTEQMPRQEGQTGRTAFRLTKQFTAEWCHVTDVNMFFHSVLLGHAYSEDAFNNTIRPFSDVDNTARLVRMNIHGKVDFVKYDPGRKPGIFNDEKIVGRSRCYNIYVPPSIRDYTRSEAKRIDYSIFVRFLENTFPVESDRHEVAKWCATLIAKPGLKMNYGLLLISETQGVGKTTLGLIMARELGASNVSYANEASIMSKFNGWAEKQLCIVNEIYAGHSSAAYDKLKEVVTDPDLNVEKKYLNDYKVDNHIHMFACSNNKLALKLKDTDRRWFVPKVSTTKRPLAYWQELYDWLNHQDGYRKIRLWAQHYVRDHGHALPGAESPGGSMKREVIKEGYTPGQDIVEPGLSYIKAMYDKYGDKHASADKAVEAELTDPKADSEMAKVIRLAATNTPCWVWDTAGVAAIRLRIYSSRPDYRLDKPGAVRSVAQNLGFYIGEERNNHTKVFNRAFNARVMSLDSNLASMPIAKLAETPKKGGKQERDWEINLVSLISELMGF
jgi:hypothetical protein